MLTIGLTGGIASGKSQASQYFADLGIKVIDSDKIARDLFTPNSPHLGTLRNKFGDSIFLTNGELDRKALGKVVFSNESDLKWLNDFTHPLINQQMKVALSSPKSDYVVLDIPLLIDKNGKIPERLQKLISRVLVINVSQEIQIDRILKRDGLSREDALNIINSQSSAEQKISLADDIIDNSGTLSELKNKIKQLHNRYLKLASYAGNAT